MGRFAVQNALDFDFVDQIVIADIDNKSALHTITFIEYDNHYYENNTNYSIIETCLNPRFYRGNPGYIDTIDY